MSPERTCLRRGRSVRSRQESSGNLASLKPREPARAVKRFSQAAWHPETRGLVANRPEALNDLERVGVRGDAML